MDGLSRRNRAHYPSHAIRGRRNRVQGLRRYYAALVVRPDLFRLVRVYDDFVAILAETRFEWSFETRYEIAAEVVGRAISVSVGGAALSAQDDDPRALENGGVALIINAGACSCDEVRVRPPPAGVCESADAS